MKGHCQILFQDKNKRTLQKVNADNLVTNAYKYRLCYNIITGNSASYSFPIAESLLGGVMLFDRPLTENADNVDFPVESHLVGYGDRASDTKDYMRGTFNELESGPTDRGYTLVWDFSTSQCNKTIASVALTNKEAVTYLQRAIYNSSSSSSSEYWSYGNYHDGEYAYRVYFYSNPYRMVLKRRKAPCGNIKVSTQPTFGGSNTYLWEEFKTFPLENSWIAYDAEVANKDYLVFPTIQYTSKSTSSGYVYTNTLRYERVKISDWSYEPPVNIVLDGITAHPLYYICWSGDYVYAYYEKKLYRFNPQNPVDIREIKFDAKYTNWVFAGAKPNGLVSFWLYDSTHGNPSSDSNYIGALVYPDGETVILGAYGYYQRSGYRCYGYSTKVYPINNYYSGSICYLGTICNLASPVTKSAATTMKVIYTLTDT